MDLEETADLILQQWAMEEGMKNAGSWGYFDKRFETPKVSPRTAKIMAANQKFRSCTKTR